MAKNRLISRLRNTIRNQDRAAKQPSFIRSIISGTFFRPNNIRFNTDAANIRAKIDTMRALATDSQISTALSYYATDATVPNTSGQIIWATSEEVPELADMINDLFARWKVNNYARDHILELATVGNCFIPTTRMYALLSENRVREGVALNNNTINEEPFDVIPSHMVPAEDLLHLWSEGRPAGYAYQPDADDIKCITFPEDAMIHFSLGGCLGKYSVTTRLKDGSEKEWDVQFAEPLLASAVNPTQTLNLLEDAILLSSFVKVVKFVNVDCSDAEEEEIQSTLQQVKDAIEQQLSLNTNNGDAQSFLNPQAPNNLIYLPKVGGADPISITDLNMTPTTEADNKMLDHFENKKLSVLGVPKEALNYSSAEGLGAAGTVMSQRSALYANILERIMTAYKEGWRAALNTYFSNHANSGFVDKFQLHMSPIITTQSTVQFDKRDAALNQGTVFVDLLKNCGVDDRSSYKLGLQEILTEAFPQMGADASKWNIDIAAGGNDNAI